MIRAGKLLAALFAVPVVALGQEGAPTPSPSPSASPTRIPLWRADLPGGSYEVAIRSIIAVSTHEYVVDGVARVTELNIDTPGNVEARFYYIEPLTPNSPIGIGQATINKAEDIANEVATRVGGDQPPWEKVVKNYPTTTHAHTVEYRLETKDQVTQLFNSADAAFRSGQNTEISLQ